MAQKPILAAQLYTIREFTQTKEDFAESMQKIHNIGYKAVQTSALGPISDEDVKAIVDANELTICNTHVSFDLLQEDIESVIRQHKTWACKHVAVGSMPARFREAGEDGFRNFAKEASEVGKKLSDSGLTFSYHNHSFEFERYNGPTGLDIIYQESDPRYLMAEIDTYWVQHGGADPVAWIRRMKDRMPVVHFKDFGIEAGVQVFSEIGEGNLNWQAIVAACQEAGVEWYAIEQDSCRRDPFESLTISYKFLSGMGLS